jgi:hypothetical protein
MIAGNTCAASASGKSASRRMEITKAGHILDVARDGVAARPAAAVAKRLTVWRLCVADRFPAAPKLLIHGGLRRGRDGIRVAILEVEHERTLDPEDKLGRFIVVTESCDHCELTCSRKQEDQTC